MAVDAKLERYIALSFAAKVAAAAGSVEVQYPGTRDTPGAVAEEWYAPLVLACQRSSSFRGTWRGEVLFQVSCFARFALDRVDKDAERPWELAAAVRVALEGVSFAVQTYGTTPVAVIGHVALGPASMAYVPETDKDPGVHGVAVTLSGQLLTY